MLELQTNVDIMEQLYKNLNERHAKTVQEYTEKLSKLEETKNRLTEEVNSFKAVTVLTNYYEGPVSIFIITMIFSLTISLLSFIST